MFRRIALSLGLLVSVVVLLPFATSTAHNLRSQFTNSHRFHHHSRAWWRRHRAMLRRRQAMIARRRALQAQSQQTAAQWAEPKSADNHASLTGAFALPENVYRDGAFAMPLPNNWAAAASNRGSSSFRIVPADGTPEGQATLAVVAISSAANAVQPLPSEQRKLLGGVAFTDLRRSVIDKMITAGGWVVNDRQRQIAGHKVFEVIAQTPASPDGKPEQVWNFYFTEVNGRVYSLTTRAASSGNQRVTAGAEQFLTTFQPVEPKR
jgi:hypothetical protein